MASGTPSGTITGVDDWTDVHPDDWVPSNPSIPDSELKARQAAAKTAFEANQPSLVGGFTSEAKANLAKLFDAVINTAPGALTGNEPTKIPGLDLIRDAFAGGIPERTLIPSAKRAGDIIGGIEKTYPGNALNEAPVKAAAGEVETWAKQYFKKAVPGPIAAYIARDTDRGAALAFQEGRDTQKALNSFLATTQYQKLPGVLKSQVAGFANALATANREALPETIQPLYDLAINEYRSAKTLQGAGQIILKWGKRAAIIGALSGLGAGAGAAGYKVIDAMSSPSR